MKTIYLLKTNRNEFKFNDLAIAMKRFLDYQTLGLPCKLVKVEMTLLNQKQTVLDCSV